jgi:formiminoglutamase
MSVTSSSAGEWPSRLEPAPWREDIVLRPDDPRLGEFIRRWDGDATALTPGRPILVGFPQDDGVRRNHGRPGAAQAPNVIRRFLSGLAPWDPITDADLTQSPPLDLGNVRIVGGLEDTQTALGEVVGAILQSGAVPIVLGGGHETAYGHFLGYVAAEVPVGFVNLDAHLDLRPAVDGRGHSGSSFRQMLEHSTHPLRGDHYVCLGLQHHAAGREHVRYAAEKGCVLGWAEDVAGKLSEGVASACKRLKKGGGRVAVSLDADVVHVADVPAVSAPNVCGLSGAEVLGCVRSAGSNAAVTSFELVELCPPLDRDGQGARWAALAVWQFLVGLARRH